MNAIDTRQQRALMRHVYEDVWIGELWNRGDPAGGRSLAEAFVDHRPIDAFPNTKHGHIAMALDWNQAFPDGRFLIEDILVDADRLVARYAFGGTHLGTLSGISATGREVRMTGIDIMRFENERLAEWWHNEDILGMMQQIEG
jgi:predicted ester cyclase